MANPMAPHPTPNRLRPLVWGAALMLLLLPWVAMQFTHEVSWTLSDFLVFGALLAIACGGYEVATRVSGNRWYRAGAGVALLTAFVTVWANLAVGMIGSPANPVNLIFAVVLAVALVGSSLVRFGAATMFEVMWVTAFAQAVAAGVALLFGTAQEAGLVAGFCLPWGLAAYLFKRAAA